MLRSTYDVAVRHGWEGEAPAELLPRVFVSPGSRLSGSFALPRGVLHPKPRLVGALDTLFSGATPSSIVGLLMADPLSSVWPGTRRPKWWRRRRRVGTGWRGPHRYVCRAYEPRVCFR